MESAKKLRWYDRADLSTLVMQNLKDKQELQAVNEALHQVITLPTPWSTQAGMPEGLLKSKLCDVLPSVSANCCAQGSSWKRV